MLRRFCDETHDDNYIAMYLSDSRLTPRTFYKSLLEQLGFEPKYQRNEAKRQLHKEIEIMKGMTGVSPVAIVDEAHLLDKDMLEEIRFLMNFKMDSQSPMALILSGQTELCPWCGHGKTLTDQQSPADIRVACHCNICGRFYVIDFKTMRVTKLKKKPCKAVAKTNKK